jgi:WhiB family redox-sensing transcriptional regulator
MGDWRKLAECRNYDPELWWDKDRQREAQSICMSCPVAAECLAHAIELQDVEGVWGGLTESGRRMWEERLRNVSNAE